ncbi:MAG: hypothetical protein H6537_05135 [Bacteroidales bacterium]|nr:hypothetical protein [Bacteroidales bacterium]
MNRSLLNFLFILAFSITTLACPIGAQERGLMLSRYYSSNEYRAATQNWSIVQDNRGVMYFGNGVGVLEYDGHFWRLIRLQNNSTVRSLGVDVNGNVFVGGYNDFGYLTPNKQGELVYESLLGKVDSSCRNFEQVWEVTTFGDTVFFQTDKYVFRYAKGKIDAWTGSHGIYYLGFKVTGKYIVQEMGRGLLHFSVVDGFSLIKGGDFFKDLKVHSILLFQDKWLICTRGHGLYLYNPVTGNVSPISKSSNPKARTVNKYFVDNSFYHGINLGDGLLALSTINSDILVLDENWNVVDVIDYHTKGINSPTNYLYLQRGQALWLALDNGICRIEFKSPLRYWNDEMGISGVLTDVARRGDYFYVATGSDVFYIKNREQETFMPDMFKKVNGNFEQAWAFKYFDLTGSDRTGELFQGLPKSQDSKLLVVTRMGVFEIEGDNAKKISPLEVTYCIAQSKVSPNILWVGAEEGIAAFEYSNGSWSRKQLNFPTYRNIIKIGEDFNGTLWARVRYGGLLRITNPLSEENAKVEVCDTSYGLNSKVIDIVDIYNPTRFYSLNSAYTFDYSTNKFKELKVPDISKSSAYVDSLWFYRVAKEILTELYITDNDDSLMWFSTEKGIFRYKQVKRDYFNLPSVLIRQVLSSDSIIFQGTNFTVNSEKDVEDIRLNPTSSVNMGLEFGYNQNSLVFIYSWPYYEGESQNEYSYKLEGYDSDWSPWTTETKKEYTNLHEGNYVFKVKARNLYKLEGKPAEFAFTVLPPWYRTVWAYIGIVLIAGLFILGVIKLYTYKLIAEKNNLEKLVKERTQEILIQKEEILVQAEHLKDANDWILAKNEELETQKYEIERQKLQLEESNATKNKFFRIIAHDLRNPISTLVNSTNFLLNSDKPFDRENIFLFIKELNRLAHNTYNLLENLLDWSKSQMGSIQYRPISIDLKSIVNQNAELIRPKLLEKSITLINAIPDDVFVIADENMLNTILRNLLSNAVKFTRDNGEIAISCKVSDGTCSLSISDNGVGMDAETLNKLFTINKEVVNAGTRNEKGSGLGLILCKEFIEKMGGKIFAESKSGEGSVFTVTLTIDD